MTAPFDEDPALKRETSLREVEEPEVDDESEEFEARKLIGTTIADRYEITELIGQGGMGAVYRARQQSLSREVAVKVLHPLKAHTKKLAQRFEQEAKGAAHLQHPNLVAITDYGILAGKQPYIVMEYLNGDSLSTIVKRDGNLSLARARNIFIQICRALTYAHEKGAVHRDLKPSNIVIVRGGADEEIVKLVDFGIAKFQQLGDTESLHLTETGEVFGSPLYMSPEQGSGRSVDWRTDIYSLGCLMYEALSGEVPLMGENALQTLFKQLNETPKSLKSVRRDLPDWIDAVVMKCLAKRMEDRYQSAEDIRKDLEQGSLSQVVKAPEKRKVGKLLTEFGMVLAVVSAIVAISYVLNTPLWQPPAVPIHLKQAATDEKPQNEMSGEEIDRLTTQANQLYIEGTRLRDEGKLAQSDASFRKEISIFNSLPDTYYRAQQLSGAYAALGSTQWTAKSFNQSVETFETAVKLAESGYGKDSIELDGILSPLGNACMSAGDSAKALVVYKRRADLLRRAPNTDPLVFADALGGVGWAAREVRRDDEAAGALEEAAKIYSTHKVDASRKDSLKNVLELLRDIYSRNQKPQKVQEIDKRMKHLKTSAK